MWREKFKPLPPALWFKEIERLAVCCASDPSDREDRAVRRAHHLSMISPLALRKMLGSALSESTLELMLGRGECRPAAEMLVSNIAKVEHARVSTSGRYVAALTFTREAQVGFEANSPALAIIGAWAQFLMNSRPN